VNFQGPLIISDNSTRSVVVNLGVVLTLRISFAMVRFILRLSDAKDWTSVEVSLKPFQTPAIRIVDERQLLHREKIEKDGY